jgi:hypothetical protein
MVKCGVIFEVRTEFLNNIYVTTVHELKHQKDTDRYNAWLLGPTNAFIVIFS